MYTKETSTSAAEGRLASGRLRRMNGEGIQGLLGEANFGHRIAEDERDELEQYFVETDQWRRLFAGDIDVVYGAKGSGKSALYSLLVHKADSLFDRGIILVPGENPSGAAAFSALVPDPPTSEGEFVGLWKTYFLTLLARVLKDWSVETEDAKRVYSALEDARLLKREASLQSLLKSVRAYVHRLQSIEGGVALDPGTGMPVGFTGRILIGEPSDEQAAQGFQSVDHLLEAANAAFESLELDVWIVLDRLDVAFEQNDQLEKNALRALFKAYLDTGGLDRIGIKIFLRSDIWHRITEEGFREASHITRSLTIEWNEQSLRHLVLRRVLKNTPIADFYGVDPESVFASVDEQSELMTRMLPDQIDAGKNPKTFAWMVGRTTDGNKQPVPRELIHLISATRESQIRRLELGNDPPPDEELFDRASFKEGLREVSKVRLKQTLYAEYPGLKPFIEQLEGEKAEQRPVTLAKIWEVAEERAAELAEQLVEIGFFERSGDRDEVSYWVPFLYRDALRLVQGQART
jgi:hypothetical protein